MDCRKTPLSQLIKFPPEVTIIFDILKAHGFEGFVVGGCVRDSLLGNEPEDWDITTDALPEQVMRAFADYSIIPTGLEHGTVTLRIHHKSFEITTYRIEGEYSDHRRPDTVHFTSRIEEDLARRDFTMNAIAYHPDVGLVDPFGGREDIKKKRIVSVGVPEERFREDPLRIVRAFRFISVLGFQVEKATEQAMHAYISSLSLVAPERVSVELNKAIVGRYVETALMEYSFILFTIMPELSNMVGVKQNHPYHVYDVWTHTVKSVALASNDLIVRLTMLFHDCGKPETLSEDEKGVSHFYGHSNVSREIAHSVLRRLRYSNAVRKQVEELVEYHDLRIHPTKKAVKRVMRRRSENFFPYYFDVRKADILAQAPKHQASELKALEDIKMLYNEVLEQRECFSIASLTVGGRDLIESGMTEGEEIGLMLDHLLTLVVDEELPNEKGSLLSYVEHCLSKKTQGCAPE